MESRRGREREKVRGEEKSRERMAMAASEQGKLKFQVSSCLVSHREREREGEEREEREGERGVERGRRSVGSGRAINVALVAKLSTGIWFQSKSITSDSTYVHMCDANIFLPCGAATCGRVYAVCSCPVSLAFLAARQTRATIIVFLRFPQQFAALTTSINQISFDCALLCVCSCVCKVRRLSDK